MSVPPASAAPSPLSRLGEPLARARGRFAGSDLQRFLAWWGGELAGLLPAAWRALFAQARARLLYVPAADGIELRMEDGIGAEAIATLPRNADQALRARVEARLGAARAERPRWLLLPDGQVLRRRIVLPAAASDKLRTVLGFELDRQTPFRAEQVTFDYRVLGNDSAARTLQVELVVLPKDRLEAALADLGPLAAELSGIDALDGQGQPLRCNLLPVARRKAADHRRLWLNVALAAVALILIAFALGRALDNRRNEVERLQAEVRARQAQARKVTALTKQLDDALSGANFLATHRAAQPPLLAVLADVSQRIPDNTFLERFSEQDGQIFLTGLSTDAASLVGKLQGSPLLRNPALSGSVQPDTAVKRDRFTLSANLAGPGKGARAGASAGKDTPATSAQDSAPSPNPDSASSPTQGGADAASP